MMTTLMGVELSSPDKVLYPEQELTKRALADYLLKVADLMLPHVAGRPLALVRCPRRGGEGCFFQRHAQGSEPEPLHPVEVPEAEGRATGMSIRDEAGLVALAQLGALEIHLWGSRADRPERPDRMVFDLDPDPHLPFDRVKEAARTVRARLRGAGLTPYVMTTGGKGLHVVVPLERRHDFGEVRRAARGLAEALAASEPDRYVARAGAEARAGKVFVDYLRNGLGATAIAPYSPRAKAGAPVATPLRWDELDRLEASDAHTVPSVPNRLSSLRGDPWAGYAEAAGRLSRETRSALGG